MIHLQGRSRSLLGDLSSAFVCAVTMLLVLLLVSDLRAQPHARGPIATRKLFPTDLLFPSMPFQKVRHDAGVRFNWRLDYAQSNVFVKSGSILDILPRTGGRLLFNRQLADSLVARDPFADGYFFDLEIKRLSLRGDFRLDPRLRFGFALAVVHFGGGFMDGIIEDFHATFGIPDDDRPDFAQNTAQAFLYVDERFWHRNQRALSGLGLGDISLYSSYVVAREQRRRPALHVRAAAELPTGSAEKMHGNGGVDWAVGLIASKTFARNAVYLAFDVVFTGGWRELEEFDLATFYILQIGYERFLGERFSLLLQANSNTNPFYGKTSSGLSGFSHELTVGVKCDLLARLSLSAALTENYAYFRNSPDLSFQIGLEVR